MGYKRWAASMLPLALGAIVLWCLFLGVPVTRAAQGDPPTVTSCQPGQIARGQTNLAVVLTGTEFLGTTAVTFGSGVKGTFTVDSPTRITCTLDIALDAPVGIRNVYVTTNYGTGTGSNLFIVKAGQPTITACAPTKLERGTQQPVIITGTELLGATGVAFGAGITVTTFRVDSPTQITAFAKISTAAQLGLYNVSLTTPTGTGLKDKALEVICAVPVPSRCNPDTFINGDTGKTVIITGSGFTDVTDVDCGAGVKVKSFTIDSDTQISAVVNVAWLADEGLRAVSITSPSGTGEAAAAFNVIAGVPPEPKNEVRNQILNITFVVAPLVFCTVLATVFVGGNLGAIPGAILFGAGIMISLAVGLVMLRVG